MPEGSERRVAGSFRDPSGFVFERDGVLRRQVNRGYQAHYDRLMSSGLYDKLVGNGLLVAHEEEPAGEAPGAYKRIRPERVPFISYPYEWCFSQLQDAALATLRIQKTALDFGMTLKDASAYNLQYFEGRWVLIDTLSFETYAEGEPWAAYGQYCRHFLAPLTLMATRDYRLSSLLKHHIDGLPLDLVASLLPARTRLKPSLLIHLHLHARSQSRHAEAQIKPGAHKKMSKLGLMGLIDSLESGTKSLSWKSHSDVWAHYYAETNYSDDAFEAKKQLVTEFLDQAAAADVWDLGANVGLFSRLAEERGIRTVSLDFDPASVEANYLECRKEGRKLVLPLVMDLVNPSPRLGWAGAERESLADRGPADLAMALALIHHLVIANNVPLVDAARYFARLGRKLIIEFVPKSDSQVRRLLASRVDIFPDYTQEGFEQAFRGCFGIERREPIRGSERRLYLMRAL